MPSFGYHCVSLRLVGVIDQSMAPSERSAFALHAYLNVSSLVDCSRWIKLQYYYTCTPSDMVSLDAYNQE